MAAAQHAASSRLAHGANQINNVLAFPGCSGLIDVHSRTITTQMLPPRKPWLSGRRGGAERGLHRPQRVPRRCRKVAAAAVAARRGDGAAELTPRPADGRRPGGAVSEETAVRREPTDRPPGARHAADVFAVCVVVRLALYLLRSPRRRHCTSWTSCARGGLQPPSPDWPSSRSPARPLMLAAGECRISEVYQSCSCRTAAAIRWTRPRMPWGCWWSGC
jgi:hypothetical protein